MAKFIYDAPGGKPKFEKWDLEPSYHVQPNLLYDFGDADLFELHKLDDDTYFKLPSASGDETKIGKLLKDLKSAPEGWFQKLAGMQTGSNEEIKEKKTLEFILAARLAIYDTKKHSAIFSQEEIKEIEQIKPLLSNTNDQILKDNKRIAEEQLGDTDAKDALLAIASGKVL
jgi:hypothetical protein